MDRRGFSGLHRAARAGARAVLVLLVLAVAGCAALAAAGHADNALQNAGYQDVGVNVGTGTGAPADGLITVSYSGGPSGNEQRDARGAEKIVWDTYTGRFGALVIVKTSGGCAGPVCATRSDEIASATYGQLATAFGPRPKSLEKPGNSGQFPVPGWAIALTAGLVVLVIAAVVIALVLVLRRKGNRPPGPPGPQPWQPPPYGWPPAP